MGSSKRQREEHALSCCCCGDFEQLQDEGLVLYIFSFLHNLRDLFRLRAVCKSWCAVVLSPRFISFYKPTSQLWCVSRVRTQQPEGVPERIGYSLVPQAGSSSDYDYSMKLKNHAEVWIPGLPDHPKKCPLPLGPRGSCFVGMCSSGGLVCGMLMEHWQETILAVGNPITNTWKLLPPAPFISNRCMYMQTTPGGTSSSYRIVVLHPEVAGSDYEGPDEEEEMGCETICASVYDSRTGAWECGPAFKTLWPSASLAEPPRFTFGASIGQDGTPLGPVYTGYDPDTRTWSCCNKLDDEETSTEGTEWHFSLITWRKIFLYKGEYYLLASLTFHGTGRTDSGISIWKLDQDPSRVKSWNLISRKLWNELGCDSDEVQIHGKVEVIGDTVVVSSHYRKQNHGEFHPVAFDMVTSTWSLSYAWLNEAPKRDAECCYAFVPSLVQP